MSEGNNIIGFFTRVSCHNSDRDKYLCKYKDFKTSTKVYNSKNK
ncbi:hypothetical protein HMPREF3217_00364 [Finegoldia magna]|nr:hypothetical protein HMPREF3217_00364 [Finegoldia magna]